MNHKESHPKFLPLVVYILRPSKKLYFQCTEETQRGIKNLSFVLLFTVTICGAIFAASICKFGLEGNYKWMSWAVSVTALFYYIIDKPIIFSNINSPRIKWLRFLIAIILGIFNSFLLDSFYFRSDIVAARNKEIGQEEVRIRAEFAKTDSKLSVKKEDLYRNIDEANARISSKGDASIGEAEGTGGTFIPGKGPIWEEKEKKYQDERTETLKQNDLRLKYISQLDSTRKKNEIEKDSLIAKLPAEISKGINKDMELLHKVVILDGNFTNRLMGGLIFFIGVFLELIPLFSKSTYDISEYFERCKDQRDINDKKNSLDKEKELNIVGTRVLFEQESELIKIKRDNAEESLKKMGEYNGAILTHTTSERNRLKTIETEMKKKDPQFYESHIKPLLDKSYDKLHKATMEAILQN